MHFVWFDPLTKPVNNPIKILIINPKIILHHVLFIKYLWISKILLISIGLNSTEKNFATPFNLFFFHIMLLIVKSYEILPKHSAQSFNSEFFLF